MSTATTEKIVDRVRKMLALAERAGTPDEAGTAFALAQKLIAENALTMEQVRQAQLREDATRPADEPVLKRFVYVHASAALPTWIGMLAVAISDVNGCTVISTVLHGPAAREAGARHGVDEVKAIECWGRATDLEIVEELLRTVVGQVEGLTTRSGFTGRTALNNFRLGAVQTVCARLREAAVATRKALATSVAAETNVAARECTALALATLDVRKAKADDAMRGAYKNVRKHHSSSRTDHAARQAGRTAGGSVNLSRSKAIA